MQLRNVSPIKQNKRDDRVIKSLTIRSNGNLDVLRRGELEGPKNKFLILSHVDFFHVSRDKYAVNNISRGTRL